MDQMDGIETENHHYLFHHTYIPPGGVPLHVSECVTLCG